MHWEILDGKRKAILPILAKIRGQGFYLAGGTALALHLGHRDSVDFDFFKEGDFDTVQLFEKMRQIFKGMLIVITQQVENTLSVEIDSVRISFFTFPYKLVGPLTDTDFFPVASVKDIACMKLSAISSRSELKDYIDLYFILKEIPLEDVLSALKEKMPSLDPLLALKSLIYFDDIKPTRILFKAPAVSLSDMRSFLIDIVKRYQREQT